MEKRTMQEERKNTPKLGSIRRVCNAGMSETARNPNILNTTRILSRRTTMLPSDMPQLQKARKNMAVSKQSIVLSQSSLDIQKKIDTESKELELGLLYDEYLQAMMMNLIMKKKAEEKKHLIVTQLATVAQEIDRDTQKLIKIKTREREIINLSFAQKVADAQLSTVKKCISDEIFKKLKDVSSKLLSLLEPLDILRCNGIILPETQNEWEETQEILIKCSNALKDITNLIGSKGETYCAVNAGLKNFDETYNEIKDLQKKLEEALCNLQVLILKKGTFSLTYNESG